MDAIVGEASGAVKAAGILGISCPQPASSFETYLSDQISFQRRWQIISVSIYTLSTLATIISTSAATMYAAQNKSEIAARLAALATVLVGVEKSFLFREKWRFHATCRAKLIRILLNLKYGGISDAEAASRFEDVYEGYASQLPVERTGESDAPNNGLNASQ